MSLQIPFFSSKKKPDTTAMTVGERERQCIEHGVPEHIAIIMDGNGRWAKKRTLPRVAGHREGMRVVKEITKQASQLGVRYLTLYAFSTENWKRPKTEVDFLMKLPSEFLTTFLPELMENNVRVHTIGDAEALPKHTQDAVKNAIEQTANNTGLQLTFALNYGSRDEMLRAVKQITKDVKEGEVSVESIDDRLFESYLMTYNMPDPALVIRTSGEQRISNFLLWQIAYSEFYFHEGFWPDFTPDDFLGAIEHFQKRNRRFGGI
ncbi:MAG: isoprenyl transferase [Bacilli bacterium]